jgi:4-alpha-glucanotransferase
MLIPHHSFEPSRTYEDALNRAAHEWGIEHEYTDTWGHRHITAPEVQKAILGALGVPTGSTEELNGAMEERMHQKWSRPLPPVLVVSEHLRPREFALFIPNRLESRSATLEIRWEQGGEFSERYALQDLRTSGAAEVRGSSFLRKQLPLPDKLPLGYHDLTVSVAGGGRKVTHATSRLIVCPDRTYTPPAAAKGNRSAGIAVSLYGLRSERNWGIGDLTDLEGLIDWAVEEAGAGFIGLNPLHALANRHPFNISPYLPISIFYQNPIYLDVERIEDFQHSHRARALFSKPETQAEIRELRTSRYVDYSRVHALKLKMLKLAFVTFLREYKAKTTRAMEFQAFVDREGELLDRFATWCALDEWIHAKDCSIWIWPDWPQQFQDPESAATRAFAKKHWRLVMFHKYVQWQLDRQLAGAQRYAREKGMPIGLYHDLALATDRFGADLWAYRPFFVSDCRVGAPPDGFSPKGQDWSFPPPNFEHHRETGYRLFAESIRKNCRHGGALRFDHVMRFFRLYWISKGMEPRQGAYMKEDHEALLHILALESVRNKVVLVGEDLGTVTPKIREALDRFGILGYKVPYFEKTRQDSFKAPLEYAELALVSSSTHDLPTLAGFWYSKDIEARRAAGLLDEDGCREQTAQRGRDKQRLLDLFHSLQLIPGWFPRSAEHVPEFTGELHNAFVGFLAQAPSRLMVLNQEDLFKEAEQQNLPATTSEYPNWQHRMRFTVEELRSAQLARDFTTMFRDWVRRTGRASHAEVMA